MIKIIIDNNKILKLLETADAEQLFPLIDTCRNYLQQWMPWLNGIKNVDDTRLFIRTTQMQFAARNGLQNGIWFNGRIVGVIGFQFIDWISRYAYIGYWLGEKYQGLGLMTKACQSMVSYAFDQFHINRVEIRCAVENLKSRAIPERLRFIQEGIIRDGEWLNDHYVDHVVYGMLAREWGRVI